MKKTITFSALMTLLFAAACNNSPVKSEQTKAADSTAFHAVDTTQLAAGAVFYQCPMHPEETSDQPGACPKCGMDLEKMEKK